MASFAEDVQKLACFQAFMRALPAWCREHKTSVTFQITGDSNDVQIGFGMPPADMSEEAAQSLMARMGEEQRLMELSLLIDEMRNVGVGPEILDPMIIEATELAHRLHPGVEFDLEKLAKRFGS